MTEGYAKCLNGVFRTIPASEFDRLFREKRRGYFTQFFGKRLFHIVYVTEAEFTA